jgi:hypothetical protein
MFDIKIDGIKEAQDKLNKIINGVEELEKENSVPLDNLMTDAFVKKHTGYDTFENFIIGSSLVKKSEEITEEIIYSDEFNVYVIKNTDFKSWEEMLQSAAVEYVQKQILKNIS